MDHQTALFERSLLLLTSYEAPFKDCVRKKNLIEATLNLIPILNLLRENVDFVGPKIYYNIYKRIQAKYMQAYQSLLVDLYLASTCNEASEVDASLSSTSPAFTTTPSHGPSASISLPDLYDLVQSEAYFALTRSYLMILVGSVSILWNIKSSTESAARNNKHVITDLLQSLRCVQHPIAGLFVRHYFNKVLRDIIPGKLGTSKEDLEFTLRILVENFQEQNCLWVRYQYLCVGAAVASPATRLAERKELQVLIGANIQRISELEISEEEFNGLVLPAFLKEVTNCHESMSQAYILRTMLDLFPASMFQRSYDSWPDLLGKLEAEAKPLEIFVLFLKKINGLPSITHESFLQLVFQGASCAFCKNNENTFTEAIVSCLDPDAFCAFILDDRSGELLTKIDHDRTVEAVIALLDNSTAFKAWLANAFPSKFDQVFNIIKGAHAMVISKFFGLFKLQQPLTKATLAQQYEILSILYGKVLENFSSFDTLELLLRTLLELCLEIMINSFQLTVDGEATSGAKDIQNLGINLMKKMVQSIAQKNPLEASRLYLRIFSGYALATAASCSLLEDLLSESLFLYEGTSDKSLDFQFDYLNDVCLELSKAPWNGLLTKEFQGMLLGRLIGYSKVFIKKKHQVEGGLIILERLVSTFDVDLVRSRMLLGGLLEELWFHWQDMLESTKEELQLKIQNLNKLQKILENIKRTQMALDVEAFTRTEFLPKVDRYWRDWEGTGLLNAQEIEDLKSSNSSSSSSSSISAHEKVHDHLIEADFQKKLGLGVNEQEIGDDLPLEMHPRLAHHYTTENPSISL